jgi:hypothetical protein
MLLLFWIGARWREDDQPEAPVPAQRARAQSFPGGTGASSVAPAALTTLLVVAAWPAWAAYLDRRADADTRVI